MPRHCELRWSEPAIQLNKRQGVYWLPAQACNPSAGGPARTFAGGPVRSSSDLEGPAGGTAGRLAAVRPAKKVIPADLIPAGEAAGDGLGEAAGASGSLEPNAESKEPLDVGPVPEVASEAARRPRS